MAQNPMEVKKSQSTTLAPSSNPWREIDRLFDQFANSFGLPAMRRMFDLAPGWRHETPFGLTAPAVDISEDENGYKIEAELPGLSEQDIDISIRGDMLVLRGEKWQEEHEEKNKNHYLSERSYGVFERSFVLPEGVDRDNVDAQFSKGVLKITLPKTQHAQQQQRKIEVKAT